MRSSKLIARAAVALFAASSAALAAEPAAKAPLVFKAQEIDKTLTVGYAVRIVDVDGDKKPDVLVCDANRVVWFSNGDWKMHTVIENAKAGVKADNVCIDTADIDGDGKLDIVLGADWHPENTKAAGSLQWLQQPADLAQPWKVHKIFESSPTLHRIHFCQVEGEAKPALIVGPLKGANSTDKAGAENPTRFEMYKIPADPVKGPWTPTPVSDQFHIMHNFLPVQWGLTKGQQVLTASYEGVNLLAPDAGGKWKTYKLGTGAEPRADGNRGSSEIKWGKLKDGRKILATVEPFHGNMAVVYVEPAQPAEPNQPWPRTVLDDTLTGGHSVWCADLDGDGSDEIVIGWRDVIAGKPPTGLRVFRTAGDGTDKQVKWEMQQIDKGDIAAEDVACADLNGDGKVDIVAVGRKTKNVKIYWNETPQAKK
ncbi:MAG TPA: VCBS repeat-containing protein [Humisphaera sp.]